MQRKATNMLVIGITGGIGAGKSQVLDILRDDYHGEIIQADLVAKELEEPGKPGYKGLVELFGDSILREDGRIDTHILADKIFHDDKLLEQVNHMIHPLTWEAIKEKIRQSTAQLVAVEAALFDENSKSVCQYMVTVDTSVENRIARLMKSRGYTREKCLEVMHSQKSREGFLQMADYVIDNNGTLEDTKLQIQQMIKSMQAKEQTNETC